MALVKKFEPSTKERQTVHKETRCHYSVFIGADDQRYIQLDTFGSDDRQFPGKISQSIQFNEQGAQQLIELLEQAFPAIERSESADSPLV